ncbi:hypothetical protein [Mycolicibacterium llatzerense]|uniref:hypothetical protein n=1 Tax=Mycolicibacterium llatzerense TaxID=280871 RepID=UPI0013A6DFE1|nr:hypothetical protein [Mycolicibacterium llatzerense]
MWIVSQLSALADGQHNVMPALTVGAAVYAVVTVAHRIIRRIERMIWKAATWALVGGAGAGGGWTILDSIHSLHL